MSILKFQDREFQDKAELFKHLRDNHDRIIADKRATKSESDSVISMNFTIDQVKSIDASKAATTFSFMKAGYVYPVINTTNYLDSHSDVHIEGWADKSVKDQKGKIIWVANHDLLIGSEIAYEQDVTVMLQKMSFRDLGFDSDMETQAVIFEVDKSKIVNDRIIDRIEKNIPTQHSIRMQYVRIVFCMDSDDEGDEEYKKNYLKYIDKVANRDKAEEQKYFWAILEGKIVREGSSVLNGSNNITPMMIGQDIEPSKDTQKTEPPKGTQPKTKPVKSNGLNSFLNKL